MNVGILGTGAIANKHAEAYRNIGFRVLACSNKTETRGRDFAARWGAEFVPDYRDLCRYPGLDFVDVCTFPDFHLPPVMACAEIGRPIQVQKPIATNLDEARRMIDIAHQAGITSGVASQHRFDDATIFLKRALAAGRLGRVLQADAYVKWFRSDEYYSRPIKGSWHTEGGGALINQAIHQVDLLLYLAGPVSRINAQWQLAAAHVPFEHVQAPAAGHGADQAGVWPVDPLEVFLVQDPVQARQVDRRRAGLPAGRDPRTGLAGAGVPRVGADQDHDQPGGGDGRPAPPPA